VSFRKLVLPFSLGGRICNYVEANVSTEQPAPRENARVPRENGNKSRQAGLKTPARQRPSPSDSFTLLRPFMTEYLRGSRDFQKVYRNGKRYDGTLMTAFVLPNKLSQNRFGITASRKAVGNAVLRNRARRLLKEAFRLKKSSLSDLQERYDWVVNAKRRMPSFKLNATVEEFEKLLSRIAQQESDKS
jgi:ribonuclease P protein component